VEFVAVLLDDELVEVVGVEVVDELVVGVVVVVVVDVEVELVEVLELELWQSRTASWLTVAAP
jgi:hypothetical protein